MILLFRSRGLFEREYASSAGKKLQCHFSRHPSLAVHTPTYATIFSRYNRWTANLGYRDSGIEQISTPEIGENMAENKDYISLKEAAQLSGYSADYIGQLIRGGKLPGKQIFSNVQWMTTKNDLEQYMQSDKKGRAAPNRSYFEKAFFSLENLSSLYVKILWVAIGLLSLFTLFLMYILSVTVDHHIDERYLQKLETHVQ
jgi:hypothetical protein